MDDDAARLKRGSKQLAEKEAAADQAFALGFSCEVTSFSRAREDNDNNI
jgi:hypothetical protein